MSAAERVARDGGVRAAGAEADADAAAIRGPARSARRATFPARTTSPASACPTRSTPCTAFRSKANTSSASCLGGLRPAGSEPITRRAVGRRARGADRSSHDAERAATFDDDRQDFGGQTTRVPRQAAGRRSLDRRGDSAHLRRAAGRATAARTRRSGRIRRRGVQAAARRARPSGSRSCASGSTKRRRSSRRSR